MTMNIPGGAEWVLAVAIIAGLCAAIGVVIHRSSKD